MRVFNKLVLVVFLVLFVGFMLPATLMGFVLPSDSPAYSPPDPWDILTSPNLGSTRLYLYTGDMESLSSDLQSQLNAAHTSIVDAQNLQDHALVWGNAFQNELKAVPEGLLQGFPSDFLHEIPHFFPRDYMNQEKTR